MSRQGRFRRFRSVGSVLPRVLKGLKLDRVLAAQPAVDLWPQIAGPKTAEHTRAVEVDGKTLVIVVDGPAWMTQLRFLKPQLVKKIDGRVGKGLITDLRFVLGNAESKWQEERGNDEVGGTKSEGRS
jgi:predicted nucleic acid-binding Zn ribbon protein